MFLRTTFCSFLYVSSVRSSLYSHIVLQIHVALCHWALAEIDFRGKKLLYYDSFGGKNHRCLLNLQRWLGDEYKDKKVKLFLRGPL
jgi:Ulp1 family protease